MPGIINTGSFPKALQLGVRSWWGQYQRPATVASQVFKTVKSDKAYEEYWQEVRTGIAKVKNQGGGVNYASMQQGFGARITNVIYALGIQITHEEIINNLYPKIGKSRVESLKNSCMEAQEVVAANIFNNAFTSGTYADGTTLMNSAHPNVSGGSWSNVLPVAADLSETALEDLLIQIDNATDDVGNRIVLRGMKVVGSPYNKFNAQRILRSLGQSGNANNDDNALKSLNELPGGYVSWRYLTAPNAWFVTTEGAADGLIYQERETLQIREDNDTDTFNYKVLAYSNYAYGVGDPRCVFGTAGI